MTALVTVILNLINAFAMIPINCQVINPSHVYVISRTLTDHDPQVWVIFQAVSTLCYAPAIEEMNILLPFFKAVWLLEPFRRFTVDRYSYVSVLLYCRNRDTFSQVERL